MAILLQKTGIATAIMFLSIFTVQAQLAPSWQIDKAHTSVNFAVKHFFSTVTGKFNRFDGTIRFDPNNLDGSTVFFSIPVSSVNTENEKRDKHLQTDDFFDAQKYPNITFSSTRFENRRGDEYLVHGKLTIRNTTKDVALPFKVTGMMEHPMKKGTTILGIALETELDRTDYGVGTGSWAATAVVGDRVTIDVHMELNRSN